MDLPYQIVFKRVMNGIPFAREFGNSLKVIVCADGVIWSHFNWENIQKQESVQTARSAAESELHRATGEDIIKKELVYVPSDLDGTKASYNIIPAWKIEADSGFYFVNAVDGKLMNTTVETADIMKDPLGTTPTPAIEQPTTTPRPDSASVDEELEQPTTTLSPDAVAIEEETNGEAEAPVMSDDAEITPVG